VDNWIAAEMEIRMLGIAVWPTTAFRSERVDFFGGSQVWIDKSSCLDMCQGGGRRRYRFDKLRVGAPVAVGPYRGGHSNFFNLVNRHYSLGDESKHDVDATGGVAGAISPTSDAPRADAEQLGDSVLCEAKCAKRRGQSYVRRSGHQEHPMNESNGNHGWKASIHRKSGLRNTGRHEA